MNGNGFIRYEMTLPTRLGRQVAVALCLLTVFSQAWAFDLKRQLFGTPSTLNIFVQSLDSSTGNVVINGGDSQGPTTPFTFAWGDGTSTAGFFPGQHIYADRNRNYVATVTAHYSTSDDSQVIAVRFVPPIVDPVPLPAAFAVHIPNAPVTLGTRLYPPPPQLTYFGDSFFTVMPRATVEYVLNLSAAIQRCMVNDNMYLVNGGFSQVMLFDPNSTGGAYSLWFTDPPAFGAGSGFLAPQVQWSSAFHEMGHNFTLNMPASFYYGGNIDGNANAIFSESMAQVFQHATAYEMLNNTLNGLGDDLAAEIAQSSYSSAQLVRDSYDRYVTSGMPFSSWNNPSTPSDETFDTFMTIAYKFLAHAENDGMGYRDPLRRMVALLQLFDPSLAAQYDRLNNTPSGATFRSTLMVAALSYAFSSDLRAEMRALNFPVDDSIYNDLVVRTSFSAPSLGTVSISTSGGDGDSVLEPGESGALIVQIQNGGSLAATSLSAVLASSTPGVTIITTQPLPYANVPAGGSAMNSSPFLFAVSTSAVCGAPAEFTLTVSYAEGVCPLTFSISVPVGTTSLSTSTFSFTGSPLIPDNNPTGVNTTVPVSGLSGVLSEVDFRFNGSTCSMTTGSTTVGLDHPRVGDLVVRLSSPAATTVTLMSRPGGTGNTGHNFCQTLLRDDGSTSIQNVTSEANPYSGTYRPANPLSAFNGQSGNGNWVLNVSDLAAGSTGRVRNWSVVIRTVTHTCDAPASSPGLVSDRQSAGSPLLLARSGNDLTLSWGPSCNSGGTDYAIYEGILGTWYSHAAKLCSTQGLTSSSFGLPGGDRYYLVVAKTADAEGSCGQNSSGTEIPTGAAQCKARVLGGCP